MRPTAVDVEELLEEEERKANAAKDAIKTSSSNNQSPEAPDATRDPRRNGRSGRESREPRSDRDKYGNEREENDQRRSRKMADDVDMKDATDRPGSANGSTRSSKRRSKSPPFERDGRPSPKEREYRQRDDRGGDFYSGGGRPMRDDRYRPEEPHPRYNDRQRRDRSPPRRRHSPPRRDRRRSPDPQRRNGRPRSPPQPTDDERDRRTVFVQQLAARLRTKELKTFFEQAGKVVEAQIVKDRISGRSKGVGYVEFEEEDSVQKAIQLTGQKLLGIPIIAQLTEAEKNRQTRTSETTATQSNGVPFHRLYVGNVHFSITEEDLKNVFEPFGELEFVQLQKEDQGRSKGYGFVQFIDPAQAKEALEKMNGFDLAGRPIRVGLGNDKFTPESTQSLLVRFGSQAQQAHNVQGSAFSGMGGKGSHAGGTANFDRAHVKDAEKTGGASALDDTDVGGVNFSNYSRDALMKKLARTEEPEPKVAPRAQAQLPRKPEITQPVASRCVLLKNMYTAKTKESPNWQKEIEEDVRGECEENFGHVVHFAYGLDNDEGEIYLKFDRVEGGKNAINGLNGRFFDELMISAQFVVEAVYHMNFPQAANR